MAEAPFPFFSLAITHKHCFGGKGVYKFFASMCRTSSKRLVDRGRQQIWKFSPGLVYGLGIYRGPNTGCLYHMHSVRSVGVNIEICRIGISFRGILSLLKRAGVRILALSLLCYSLREKFCLDIR